MVERLWNYGEVNQSLPNHILFYRDGVSESQYGMVYQEELRQIKQAVTNIAVLRKVEFQPKITLLVVGKRHHTRFFPKKSPVKDKPIRAGDRESDYNIQAGLVIDHTIVTPHHCSFYLQSHDSPQGTAKTGHYVIITNESEYSLDALQQLVSHLGLGHEC